MPLDNTFMKTVTCIDPLLVVSPTEIQLKSILNFPQLLSRVLNEDDDEDEVEMDCMKWWILLRPKYPIVFKLVTAAFSIFQGPHAETTFNVMGDVIEKHSG